MPSFYLIAVILTVIFLILCLTGVGILMKYQNAGQVFPPAAQPCPDGWTVDALGNCGVSIAKSLNIGRLGSTNGKDLNMNSPYFTSYTFPATYITAETNTDSLSSLPGNKDISMNFTKPNATWTTCQQKNWANRYGIEWDGVSNYNGSC